MTASTATGGEPLVVGLGGTPRANSSTERALRYCLSAVEQQGGRTRFFSGLELDLPMYAPHELERTPKALELVGALRDADAVGTLGQLRSIGHALRAWPTPLGVAINSGDKIWDEAGELADSATRNQLDLLATQLLTFAGTAWESA
jgi:FMN reductase